MYDKFREAPQSPAGEPNGPRRTASVWPTGQHDLHAQLAEGGYVTGTADDDGAMPPALAAHAIAAYTRPGAVVLDPDCGAGTVLVEALRAGRHAIGLTTGHRWRMLARANLAAVRRGGAVGDGMVRRRRVATPHMAYVAGLGARVDLLLTTVRPRLSERTDPVDAAAAVAHIRALLADCRPLLRPSAYVALTVRPGRGHGELVDLPSRLFAAGADLGLVPIERCVALSAAIRGGRLVSHAGLAARRAAARQQRATGHPVCLIAHRDVLVWRSRPDADAVDAAATTALSPRRASARQAA
jgi:hypothetical protein